LGSSLDLVGAIGKVVVVGATVVTGATVVVATLVAEVTSEEDPQAEARKRKQEITPKFFTPIVCHTKCKNRTFNFSENELQFRRI